MKNENRSADSALEFCKCCGIKSSAGKEANDKLEALIQERVAHALHAYLIDFQKDLQDRLNAITPPDHITELRKEYWKAGSVKVILAINEALLIANQKAKLP